ncbi:MAG TPA: NAD(P)H-hydrate dehydratase [Streptosporangiaceae bacterium]|nr:NAD(P)H-hydrate dehydratase [Streptosporangiaceae bacterium]
MRTAHAVAAVREAEGALMAELPDGVLMQRAAAGLAAACAGLLRRDGRSAGVYGSRVVVLAGSGDNGGDALYAGARLAARGVVVTAIAAAPRIHEGGAAALRACGGRVIEAGGAGLNPAVTSAIEGADLIVDGLLGIGGRGGLREPAAQLAKAARGSRAPVVAVDLPSGIDADSGEAAGAAIQADVTVTFGTLKPGLLIDPGASHAGVVELVDIGLAAHLAKPDVAAPQAADVGAWLPRPSAESDKYRRGVLGIVAGSDRFTGAAQLSVGGAIRGGAGMVRLVSAETAVAVVRQHWPEAVITTIGAGQTGAEVIHTAGQVQAWVAGPGMGTDAAAAGRLEAVLATELPVLVDADGITLLADADHRKRLLRRASPTLITPHAGELARLLGADRADIEAHRLRFVTQAAKELGCTVLLKGSTTVIAAPQQDHPVLVNSTGTSWLATAGSGDVLSGLAGSLLAQGLEPQHAAAAAAFLHGIAARLSADGVTGETGGAEAAGAAQGAPIGASDLLSALPAATRVVKAAADT